MPASKYTSFQIKNTASVPMEVSLIDPDGVTHMVTLDPGVESMQVAPIGATWSTRFVSSDITRESSDATREESYATREGSDATREGSDATREGSDATREGSDATREGSDATREGSDATREGSDATN